MFFDLFFMRYKAGREIIKFSDIEDSYFNFALILLLTLTLGTFSLVQYNKIIKKDNEEQ